MNFGLKNVFNYKLNQIHINKIMLPHKIVDKNFQFDLLQLINGGHTNPIVHISQ